MRGSREVGFSAFLLILIVLTLVGCGFQADYHEGPISSPGSKLEVSAFVNRTDSKKQDYFKVMLIVNDKTTGETIEQLTGIGHAMKWAIGWYSQNVIVAQSSDIGTRSWEYLDGELVPLEVTDEMHQFAGELRAKKYNLD